MVFKTANRMKLDKITVFCNMPYVQKYWNQLPVFIEKQWRHGQTKGKGKSIANAELWQKIVKYKGSMEVQWIHNPKGQFYMDVQRKAASMALLPSEK